MKKRLTDAQNDRASYFDKVNEYQSKFLVASARNRNFETEVLRLKKKLKREETKNGVARISKVEKGVFC